MQLLHGRGEGCELPSGEVNAAESVTSEVEGRRGGVADESEREEEGGQEDVKWRHAPPTRVTESHTISTKGLYMSNMSMHV